MPAISPLILVGLGLIFMGAPVPNGGLIAGILLLVASILLLVPVFR